VVNFHIARKVCLTSAVALSLTLGVGLGANAQNADASAEQYASVLKQIADVKLSIAQKEVFIGTQSKRIASLQSQIAGVDATKATVDPMLAKMATAIEGEINSDLPFKATERFNRLDDFREALADKEATPGEKMRKALNLYDIEVSYGNSVSAYPGDNPKAPGTRFAACEADAQSSSCGLSDDQIKKMEAGATVSDLKSSLQDGSYLHFGRLSLIYVQHDSSEAWQYNKESKDWAELKGADVLNARRSVRIAKGESAPGVVTAPILK